MTRWLLLAAILVVILWSPALAWFLPVRVRSRRVYVDREGEPDFV